MSPAASGGAATISVVIPLYYHQQSLDATLDSVLNQSRPPEEIIVIDVGSTEDYWSRLRRRAAADRRLITWRQPMQGAHQAINAGVHRATGDYLAILNSDDCYHPRRLATCLAALEAAPAATAVCTGLDFLDGRGRPRRNPWYEEAADFYRREGELSLALINGNFLMTTSNLFLRRTAFAELGYFADLRYAHDLDFLLRLLAHGRQILLLEPPLLSYRLHDSNTISEDHARVKAEWAATAAFFARRRGRGDWRYWRRLLEITDRHNLSRLLLLFFAYFEAADPAALSPGAFRRDPEFMALLAEVTA